MQNTYKPKHPNNKMFCAVIIVEGNCVSRRQLSNIKGISDKLGTRKAKHRTSQYQEISDKLGTGKAKQNTSQSLAKYTNSNVQYHCFYMVV